jgi:hypothetical protein
MDGVGVNINSLSWMNGESKPAIDRLADEMGCTVWRVVFDMEDWENPNDNADPATPDWTYYNALYSNAKFQNLWGTLAYLEGKGFTNSIALSFMGRVPTWMGGSTINSAAEDEWVEMMATLMYYARNTRGLQFKILDPLNETDWDGIEGPQVNATQYVRLLHKLSQRLDAMGLTDVRFLGPNTASVSTGVNTYIPAMRNDAVVNARVDHFGLHDYGGGTGGAATALQGSGKNFWMTENADPAQMMNMIGQNANAVLLWEGFDSVYNHAILAGRGTTPPNDDPGINLPPLSYNTTNKTYAARPLFYQYESVFKFIPPGAVRINTTDSAANVTLYAFTQPSTGRVTIIGQNTGSATSMTTTLTSLPSIATFEFYQATNSSFQRNADIPVSGTSFTFNAPANAFFSLTGIPGGTSAGNVFYIRDGGTSTTCTDWSNACDTLPAALQRGATYYLAAGSYGSPTFSTALSGSAVITLKGATTSDHGTSTGWSDAYAVTTAPAVFKGITFLSGFWTLDGSVGSLSELPSAYGFLIDNTAGCADNDNGIALGNGNAAEFSNMTFKHIAFENCTADIWSDGINTHGQILRWINSTVSDSLFEHWQGAIAFNGASANQNITIERNIFMNGHSSSHAHGEQINANGADVMNMVLRYNVFKDNGGTGTVVGNNSNIANSFIYGNLFIRDTVGNGIITGTSVGDLVNTMIYNNTFVSKVSGGPWVSGEGGTGNIARNNLVFGMDASAGTGVTLDNNAYFQTTNTPTETNRQTGANNPFLNSSGGNYHLAAATTAGQVLPAPFNIDPNGNGRGADGVWDRGAYEFVSSSVTSACDLNGDGSANVSDVQLCANQAIGMAACSTADINKDGACNVIDVQRVVNSALGGQCVTQ